MMRRTDRPDSRRAPRQTTGKLRLQIESLEQRMLLSINSGGDTTSGNGDWLTQAAHAALVDFQGADLTGKDGPLAKIGYSLSLVYEQQKLHDSTAQTAAYKPTDAGIQTSGSSIAVDVLAGGNLAAVQNELTSLGMTVVATTSSVVSGWLPIAKLPNLAALADVQSAAPAYKAFSQATTQGSVVSQGDKAIGADVARSTYGVDGTGITVGVMSDSFNTDGTLPDAAADKTSGDLPAVGVTIIKDWPNASSPAGTPPGTDEGRAMVQIVHDVAPGAAIAFATGNPSQAAFAANIQALADAGSQVIVDDLVYPNEPMFQDGVVAKKVDQVTAAGVTYISAALNYATQSYQSAFNNTNVPLNLQFDDGTPITGGTLHNFNTGAGAAVTSQQVTIPLGDTVSFSLQWNQAFKSLGGAGATSDVDIYLVGGDGKTVVALSNFNNLNDDALEVMDFANDGSYDFDNDGVPDTTFSIEIALAAGPAPTMIKYVALDETGITINTFDTASSTSFGHANAVGDIAVAAAAYYNTAPYGVAPAQLENFSSLGGTPIYFDSSNNLLSTPVTRQDPSVTGPDGVATTFFSGGKFYGTSAASPHVAGVAALMLQGAGGPGSLTPAEVRTALQNSATPITTRVDPFDSTATIPIPGPVGYNLFAGYGMVDAAAAVKAVVPTPPVANDDMATTLENQPIPINVLLNDTDAIGTIDPTTVKEVTAPLHGTLSIDKVTGLITYTPAKNYSGSDTFQYTVKNNKGLISNVGNVAVGITFVDQPPVAGDVLASTQVNTPVTIDALASVTDPDVGDTFSNLKIVQQPGNGLAAVVNGKIVYTPNSNVVGGDLLKYTVTDSYNNVSQAGNIEIRIGDPVVLAGNAFIDTNGDGHRENGESGIAGVQIVLTKNDGPLTFSKSVYTAADGSFSFAENPNQKLLLPAGNYTITEIHPGYYVDAPNAAGSGGGTASTTTNVISNIQLGQGTSVGFYDFAESGIASAFVTAFLSRRAFLSTVNANLPAINLQQGAFWISYDAGIQGTLATQATFNPAQGSVTMTLYDSNLKPVATSTAAGGQAQLNYTANSSSAYFVQVSGTNPLVSVHTFVVGQQVGSSTPTSTGTTTAPVSQWQNTTNHFDVNGDGRVTTTDAVAVINLLKAGKSGALANLTGLGSLMVDANGDRTLSTSDAVAIINAIKAAASKAAATQAVSTPAASTQTVSPGVTLATDQAVGQLFTTTSAANTNSTGSTTPASTTPKTSTTPLTTTASTASTATTTVRSSNSRLDYLVWADEQSWKPTSV